MPAEKSAPGSVLRTLLLAGTVAALSIATFENAAAASAVYYPRYITLALLLLVTRSQGQPTRIALTDAPRPARTLIRGAWLLVILAFASTTWSADPRETLFQSAAWALIVATMHSHITHRWHTAGTLERDLKTVFYVLGTTMIASVPTGTLVGGRLAGLYQNPNMLGILACFTLALGIAVLSSKGRLIALVMMAAAALALLGSENRTGLVAVGLFIAWLGVSRIGRLSPMTVVALCWSGAAAVAFVLFGGKITLPAVASRFTEQGDLLSGRAAGWQYAIALWEREPLTGFGFRAGEAVFERYAFQTSFTRAGAHNSYLQILLELGYLGMVPCLLLLIGLVAALWRARRGGAVASALSALVIAGLVTGMTESALFGVGQSICWVFWFGAAALAALSTSAPPDDGPVTADEPVPRQGRRPASARR